MRVPLTIGDFLRRAAAVYGDRTAVVDEPGTPASLGSLTYRQLEARARGMALASWTRSASARPSGWRS